MDEASKVHLLSHELIPIVNDIEPEVKEIVMDHIASCESCQKLYSNAYELDALFPEKDDKPLDMKPLKKLVQFNQGIKLLLIMIRVVILSYVIFSSVAFMDFVTDSDIYLYIQSSIYFFYLPAALFLLVFTFVFLNKKWLIFSAVIDVPLIFGLDLVFKLFLFT